MVDGAGRVLGTAPFGADRVGYEQLEDWLRSQGRVSRVGVEGTGSYGAGLARYLTAAGVEVVEVNRPNRQLRRQRGGKTDSVDAEAAARAAASGQATAVPKSGNGPVECIRMLLVARRSATKARTQAANQIHSVTVTAPEPLKRQLRDMKLKARASHRRSPGPATAERGGEQAGDPRRRGCGGLCGGRTAPAGRTDSSTNAPDQKTYPALPPHIYSRSRPCSTTQTAFQSTTTIDVAPDTVFIGHTKDYPVAYVGL